MHDNGGIYLGTNIHTDYGKQKQRMTEIFMIYFFNLTFKVYVFKESYIHAICSDKVNCFEWVTMNL